MKGNGQNPTGRPGPSLVYSKKALKGTETVFVLTGISFIAWLYKFVKSSVVVNDRWAVLLSANTGGYYTCSHRRMRRGGWSPPNIRAKTAKNSKVLAFKSTELS